QNGCSTVDRNISWGFRLSGVLVMLKARQPQAPAVILYSSGCEIYLQGINQTDFIIIWKQARKVIPRYYPFTPFLDLMNKITFIILRNIKKPTERLSQSAYLSQAVCALPSFNMAGKIAQMK
ncbi:hypothetical protein, partial [Klebsiella quasipneumoniae]